MEAVFRPVPAGKYSKLTGIHRKKSRRFPVGILLPCFSDFRCFPAGSGDFPASFLQDPAGSGGRNHRPGFDPHVVLCRRKNNLSISEMYECYNTFLHSDADHQCRWFTAQPCFYLSSRTLQPISSHENNLFRYKYILTSCSESEKLNKFLVEYWIREVLDKVTSNRFLLLIDEWSPQAGIKALDKLDNLPIIEDPL